MKKKSLIYDFETLGGLVFEHAALCIAWLEFEEEKMLSSEPYNFETLVNSVKFCKFDVTDQVKNYGRKIDKSTLTWWSEQDIRVKSRVLTVKEDDVPLEEFIIGFENIPRNSFAEDYDNVYCRGTDFDPPLLTSLFNNVGKKNPIPYWMNRDTRSYIDGLTYGSKIKNTFIPEDVKGIFIEHDPSHDIAMDVYRIQHIKRILK